jgi:hypothetical protein
MSTITAVPAHDAITPGWMTEVLLTAGVISSARVTAVEREPCGTGLLADSYRFTLTYDSPSAGPPTLVGKFASDDPTSRAYGHASGMYRNEICFYQELAARLDVALPTPVHAALAENETDFVLLMDDLAPARAVDQIVGCTADEAALVMEQAAALHGGSWRSGALAATDWLKRSLAGWMVITDGFGGTVSSFSEAFGDLIPDADLAEASRLVPHCDLWKRILSEPLSLWHNDLRADNVLFDAHDGSMPIAVLDWQGVTYARGTLDVAYFLGTSLTTEDRRAHERDLVAHYHAALVAQGATELSGEDCWNEYRLLAIHPLQTGVFGLGAVKRSERGDAMWRNWIDRSATMTRDLDSFEVLTAMAH